MKLLFILSLFTFSTTYGQKFKFGPEIGMNVINVEQPKTGDNYQLGWHTGVLTEYSFNKNFSLKSGVYYTQKRQGFESTDTVSNFLSTLIGQLTSDVDLNTYVETTGRHTLNYIQIPLLATYSIKRFSVSGGFYGGYLFNSRTKTLEIKTTPFVSTIDISSFDPTGLVGFFLPKAYEEDFSESTSGSGLSEFDFGVKGDLGYEMDNFGLNVSYLYGFTDYRSSNVTNPKFNNSYFQFSIHYLFGITKTDKIRFSKM